MRDIEDDMELVDLVCHRLRQLDNSEASIELKHLTRQLVGRYMRARSELMACRERQSRAVRLTNRWKVAAAAVLLAAVTVVAVGMYSTWRDCTAAGGVTVRGLFWLECINARGKADVEGSRAVR